MILKVQMPREPNARGATALVTSRDRSIVSVVLIDFRLKNLMNGRKKGFISAKIEKLEDGGVCIDPTGPAEEKEW